MIGKAELNIGVSTATRRRNCDLYSALLRTPYGRPQPNDPKVEWRLALADFDRHSRRTSCPNDGIVAEMN